MRKAREKKNQILLVQLSLLCVFLMEILHEWQKNKNKTLNSFWIISCLRCLSTGSVFQLLGCIYRSTYFIGHQMEFQIAMVILMIVIIWKTCTILEYFALSCDMFNLQLCVIFSQFSQPIILNSLRTRILYEHFPFAQHNFALKTPLCQYTFRFYASKQNNEIVYNTNNNIKRKVDISFYNI